MQQSPRPFFSPPPIAAAGGDIGRLALPPRSCHAGQTSRYASHRVGAQQHSTAQHGASRFAAPSPHMSTLAHLHLGLYAPPLRSLRPVRFFRDTWVPTAKFTFNGRPAVACHAVPCGVVRCGAEDGLYYLPTLCTWLDACMHAKLSMCVWYLSLEMVAKYTYSVGGMDGWMDGRDTGQIGR
ncbi:hypothetical protein BS50DRAFT_92911 [Corynespora cassiicola Philippines]|uniref:Uncharacterized protein n=1 Tax=Corynespora cassiicola Philippines TaxID=1448308 RepID=A0A2T2NFV4_CORCC|nr:hypothetical protein BS50DRAFT_92911 [Corynespora cassiicola Philippines]